MPVYLYKAGDKTTQCRTDAGLLNALFTTDSPNHRYAVKVTDTTRMSECDPIGRSRVVIKRVGVDTHLNM